jgi:hypothetical protein
VVKPVEEEEDAEEEKRARDEEVGGNVESAPRPDEVEDSERREECRANPFPTPGNDQYGNDEHGGNEVHEKSNNNLGKRAVLIEYVERKHADEERKEDAETSRSPEQPSLGCGGHDRLLAELFQE